MSAIADGPITSLPFSDDFEGYADETPLVDGINGWDASSDEAIVQTKVVFEGDKAAQVPIDVTLSSHYNSLALQHVWVEMAVRPVFYGTDEVVAEADPVATALFYFSPDGKLVVHPGPCVGETNWVAITERPNGSAQGTDFTPEAWVRIHLFQDFTTKKYSLFANNLLMALDVPFVNPNATTFNSFDVYNGSGATTFLDNVAALVDNPASLAEDAGDFVPEIGLSQTTFSKQIFEGQSPDDETFNISKVNGFFPLHFANSSGAGWLDVETASGDVDSAPATITLTFDTAALPVQTTPYTSAITVQGTDNRFGFASANSPAAVNVSLYIQKMAVNPAALTCLLMQGNNAADQTFDVTASGAGTFNYTVAKLGGVNWVTPSSDSGSLNGEDSDTITLGYSAASLAPGKHTETIRVASSTGGGATQDVALVVNVQSMDASPSSLNNFVMQGNKAADQAFAVESTGEGEFSFGITINGNSTWALVDPSAGTLTDTDSVNVNVEYDTVGLAPGGYTDSFKIFTAAGGGATRNVPLQLNVQSMTASPASLNSFIMQGNNPAAQAFTVASAGKGSFAFAIANSGSAWATVEPGTGTLTDNNNAAVTVNYNAAGLAPGTHAESFKVFTTDGGGATQTVALALDVQSLNVSANALSGEITEGQTAPSQTFKVQSAGAGSFPYTVSVVGGATWLAPSPAAGTLVNAQSDTISISYSTAGLAPGEHKANLRIATTAGGGAEKTVEVTMTVTGGSAPAGPPIQVAPTQLAQATTQGQNPPAQSFTITTTNASAISYYVSVPKGAEWITPSPNAGTIHGPASREVTLAYMTAGLTPGVHTGLVSVITPDAGGATQHVTVVMAVTPMSGPLSVMPTLLATTVIEGESAQAQEFSVFTTGSVAVAYTVTPRPEAAWFSVEPLSGVLTNAQQTDTVAVAYSTETLPIGLHTALVEVATSSAGGATQNVTLLMTVLDKLPAAPELVSAAQGAMTDRIRVQWQAVQNAQRYSIWRHTSNTPDAASETGALESSAGPGTLLAYDDLSAQQGVRYYYWIKAHNPAGPSPFSASATGWLALPAPATIAATQGEIAKCIRVTWAAVGGADSYEVWRSLTPAIADASLLATTEETAYLDENPENRRLQYYWAKARNNLSVSPFSHSCNGYCRPISPADFDGDGKADGWYYYQPNGAWYILPASGGAYCTLFGWWETEAAPGDYDGNGSLNLGVYHRNAGVWYMALDSGLCACAFGHASASPIPGDYDGDRITDMGVYFPENGAWYILKLDGTLLAWNLVWGGPGMEPVRGDFDGDGIDDLAVYDTQTGNWYIIGLDGTLIAWAFPFGFPGAQPVSGDFDGDRRADFAVYYPPFGLWYIYTWQGDFTAIAWGWNEASPVPADFDGDKRTDLAVFHHDRHDARWYLLQSTDGYRMISTRENR